MGGTTVEMAKEKTQTLIERLGFQDPDLATPEHDRIMVWLNENMPQIIADKTNGAWDRERVSRMQHEAEVEVADCLTLHDRRRLEETARTGVVHAPKSPALQADGTIHVSPETLFGSGIDDVDRDLLVRSIVRETINEKSYYLRDSHHIRRILPGITESGCTTMHASAFSGNAFSAWKMPDPPDRPASSVLSMKWEKPVLNGSYIVGFIDLFVEYETFLLARTEANVRSGDMVFPSWHVVPNRASIAFEVKPKIPSLGELIRQVNTYKSYLDVEIMIASPDDRFRAILEDQRIGFVKTP